MTEIDITSQSELAQYPLSSDEIRLLAEIGFMAATAGQVVPATRIFEGLCILRPHQPFPYIGLALSRMFVGAWQDAIRILRDEGLRVNPDNPELQLYLCLALLVAQQPGQGERLLSALLVNGHLETAEKLLALSIQAQIDGKSASENQPRPAVLTDGES